MSVNLNGKNTHEPLTEAEQVYATNFGSFTKEYVKSFDFTASKNHGAILSTTCGHHAVSLSDRFFTERALGNHSQSDVLREALDAFENNKEF
jgi:hypothetical protein